MNFPYAQSNMKLDKTSALLDDADSPFLCWDIGQLTFVHVVVGRQHRWTILKVRFNEKAGESGRSFIAVLIPLSRHLQNWAAQVRFSNRDIRFGRHRKRRSNSNRLRRYSNPDIRRQSQLRPQPD